MMFHYLEVLCLLIWVYFSVEYIYMFSLFFYWVFLFFFKNCLSIIDASMLSFLLVFKTYYLPFLLNFDRKIPPIGSFGFSALIRKFFPSIYNLYYINILLDFLIRIFSFYFSYTRGFNQSRIYSHSILHKYSFIFFPIHTQMCQPHLLHNVILCFIFLSPYFHLPRKKAKWLRSHDDESGGKID